MVIVNMEYYAMIIVIILDFINFDSYLFNIKDWRSTISCS
jgi:hypothetical protein